MIQKEREKEDRELGVNVHSSVEDFLHEGMTQDELFNEEMSELAVKESQRILNRAQAEDAWSFIMTICWMADL